MTKRVGILGGTFNPIHLGHVAIAKAAYDEFDLDEILFIPSGISYMKSNVTDAKIRAEMTALAIKDYPNFVLSDMEINRPGNSYSYETILSLKKEHPDTEYFFIVGADSFVYMEHWKCPDLIFANAHILVAIRNGSTKKDLEETKTSYLQKFNANIDFISFDGYDVSSSDIRNRVKEGRAFENFVSDAVFKYIKDHKLYLDGDNEDIRRTCN